MVEKFVEGVELKVPSGGTVGEPGLGLFEGRGTGSDEVDATRATALDEAGALEDAQMARDGGRRDRKRFGEDGDRALTALAEADEDGAARGVGESGENGIDCFGIINHAVKYSAEAGTNAIDI
jgi:hypothetical protein